MVIKEEHQDFIEFGAHDALIGFYVDTVCRLYEHGVASLESADQVQRYVDEHLQADPVVAQFAGTCLRLITKGYDGFYYRFLVDLEYQRAFRAINDDQTLVALHLAKTLSSFLGMRNGNYDVFDLSYLVQSYCTNWQALNQKLSTAFSYKYTF